MKGEIFMKGLLLKDFYFVLKRNTLLFIIALLFTVAGSVALLGISVLATACMYGIFFFMMATMSTLTYDETTKWHIYCDTFPISRKTFVTEKYFFIIGSNVVLWLASSVLTVISNIKWQVGTAEMLNTIISNVPMIMGMSVMPCIIFPLTFKFGYQKARIALLVMIGVYSGLVSMILSAGTSDNENPFAVQSAGNIPVTIIFVGIMLLLYFISWLISVKVYSKREL